MKDKELFRLVRLVQDVRRLRYSVSKMSFITESLCWIRMPRIVRDEE